MSEASYTAWDDNLYEWPPPDGWYQADDGKWWPQGYGPSSDERPGGSNGSDDSLLLEIERTSIFPAGGSRLLGGSSEDRLQAESNRPVYDELPNIDDVFGDSGGSSKDREHAVDTSGGDLGIDDVPGLADTSAGDDAVIDATDNAGIIEIDADDLDRVETRSAHNTDELDKLLADDLAVDPLTDEDLADEFPADEVPIEVDEVDEVDESEPANQEIAADAELDAALGEPDLVAAVGGLSSDGIDEHIEDSFDTAVVDFDDETDLVLDEEPAAPEVESSVSGFHLGELPDDAVIADFEHADHEGPAAEGADEEGVDEDSADEDSVDEDSADDDSAEYESVDDASADYADAEYDGADYDGADYDRAVGDDTYRDDGEFGHAEYDDPELDDAEPSELGADHDSTDDDAEYELVDDRAGYDDADHDDADHDDADHDGDGYDSGDVESAAPDEADLDVVARDDVDLETADLETADLETADLDSADLDSADLDDADLDDADLEGVAPAATDPAGTDYDAELDLGEQDPDESLSTDDGYVAADDPEGGQDEPDYDDDADIDEAPLAVAESTGVERGRSIWPVVAAAAVAVAILFVVAAFVVTGRDDASGGFDAQAALAVTGEGSLSEPYPAGSGAIVYYPDAVTGDERRWVIQIVEPISDRTAELVAEGGAVSPAAGSVLATTTVRLTYRSGPTPGPADDLTMASIGSSLALFGDDARCNGVSDQLDQSLGLEPGQAIEGELCWEIPEDEMSDLKLAIEAGPVDGMVFVELG